MAACLLISSARSYMSFSAVTPVVRRMFSALPTVVADEPEDRLCGCEGWDAGS